MAGSLLPLTGGDIIKIRLYMYCQLNPGNGIAADFMYTAAVVGLNMGSVDKAGYTPSIISKIHDTYRLLRDQNKVPDWSAATRISTTATISNTIAPSNPAPWAAKVIETMYAIETGVSKGLIKPEVLYKGSAIATEQLTAADTKNIGDKAKALISAINPLDSGEVKKNISMVEIAIVAGVGLYLYSIVTANRALSRWRNR